MVEPMPGPYTVYFDFDRAELTPDAQAELSEVIQSAQQSGAQSIDITGYTDLSGAEAYNQVLSERRANSVIEFLVGGGVDAARIVGRSEEHTSELQSLMRTWYAVFCLKKKRHSNCSNTSKLHNPQCYDRQSKLLNASHKQRTSKR